MLDYELLVFPPFIVKPILRRQPFSVPGPALSGEGAMTVSIFKQAEAIDSLEWP
jgi:hypothetical protein